MALQVRKEPRVPHGDAHHAADEGHPGEVREEAPRGAAGRRGDEGVRDGADKPGDERGGEDGVRLKKYGRKVTTQRQSSMPRKRTRRSAKRRNTTPHAAVTTKAPTR